jgi:hypothetical protein
MDKTTKTVLIVGGLLVLVVGGIIVYTKFIKKGDETKGGGDVTASTKQNRVIVTRK